MIGFHMAAVRTILTVMALILVAGTDRHWAAFAQQSGAMLPIERAFAAPGLDGPRARKAQLSPDGRRVAYLKADPADTSVQDLWLAGVPRGEPFRLVAGAAVRGDATATGDAFDRRERLRIRDSGITEYVWSDDGGRILIPTGGGLWIADVERRFVQPLAGTTGNEIDPRFSPAGRFISFVRDRNLFAIDLSNGRVQALTTGGGGAVAFGLAEFVAQEEMRRSSGYWWSPDDRYVAVQRYDESGVDLVPRLLFENSAVRMTEQRYPRAGTANAEVGLFIAEPTSGQLRRIELDFGQTHYLARANWSRDGRTLYVQRQSRDQKILELIAVDAATGAQRILLTERSETWVELSNDFWPLSDGGFLWTSERSGNRHIYRHARDGRLVRQLTDGDWPVASIEGVDERRGTLFFAASMTPIERHLYAVSLAGADRPRRLTSGEGWWRFAMAQRPSAFLGTYSDPATPPRTAVYAADGDLIRWIERNPLDETHPYWPYRDGMPQPRFGTIRAEDGTVLHYAIQLPAGFDPRRRYPAIVSVYGGPMVQEVRREWGDASDRLLLDRGYVVFRLDNRGSANRSAAFKSAIAGQLGRVEVQDQLAGARHLASLPFVDPDRIGVMGWSYGGFMTLMLMTEPGSPFRAGAAGAAVTDWRLYDTHYAERFMGSPLQNPQGYQASDAVQRVDRLRGRLLLLHGMADDNVTFDNAMRLTAALQSRGVAFEEMIYPGQAHLLAGSGRLTHLWRTYLDFFDRALAPSDPPARNERR